MSTRPMRALLTAFAVCIAAACSAIPTESARTAAGETARMNGAPPPSDTTASARGIGMFGSGN